MTSAFLPFAITFGSFTVLCAILIGWMFKTSSAPILLKVFTPAILVGLSIYAPFQVSNILGSAREITYSDLPEEFTPISYLPINHTTVELWIKADDVGTRLYRLQLTPALKKIIRESEEKREAGIHVKIRKNGAKLDDKNAGKYDSGGGIEGYELKDITEKLPPKE
jgi:hypothetical protein